MALRMLFNLLMVAVGPIALAEASAEAEGLPHLLNLAAAQRIALRDNPSLKAAAARVEQAKRRVEQARSAFFPNVGAGWSVAETHLDENSYGAARRQATAGPLNAAASAATFPRSASPYPLLAAIDSSVYPAVKAARARNAVDDDITTYGASLSAHWLLFDGLAREFTYAAARFGAQESEAAHLEAKRLLLSAVASTYYGVALAREEMHVAEADEAFNERLVTEAKARREAGAGSLSDALNFEVRMNGARAARIRAEQAYAMAMVGLAELLALPESAFPQGTELAPLEEETSADLAVPDVETLVERALTQRPDLRLSEHALARNDRIARARRGALFPEVSATAAKTAQSVEDSHINEDDFSTVVGLNVSYTLFAGGRNRAQWAEAQAAREEARHNLHQAELTVVADVRGAAERLTSAQKQLVLQRANADLVQRNRDLVEKEYRAGQASLVRLNEAQKDLTTAQGQLALARVTVQQAWHDLRTATAEILEPISRAE